MQFRRSGDRNKETGGWRRCCSTVGRQLFREQELGHENEILRGKIDELNKQIADTSLHLRIANDETINIRATGGNIQEPYIPLLWTPTIWGC
ncbi:hypothetical protein L1887_18038 [Cichorium endivia]|nr:hypothetical protein L1887_18038 [Cichorium endivia]